MLDGRRGETAAMAMRIVVRIGEILGAEQLVEISSAHVDGCLYHGDGGVEFAERLVAGGGKVCAPTTLNVGALDLLHPAVVRADPHRSSMARRQMEAYVELGCEPTWTGAPDQAGHRPGFGEHVAWGESNAVAFVNSVLGARTNRYGDFLDICCALVGRAPYTGLHLAKNRRATVVVDTSALPLGLKSAATFFPVFGTWLGRAVATDVAVIDGLPCDVTEDQLKALGAAASSTGSVGLFHVSGVTPEAPDIPTALDNRKPMRTVQVTASMIRDTRYRMSTTHSDRLDAVAVGCPHFSLSEFAELERLVGGTELSVPFYVCAGRGVAEELDDQGRLSKLREVGIKIVVDTCVVVTSILPDTGGVLMTNSGKFAHYAPANTGYDVVLGTLADCVASAKSATVSREDALWR